ncbi:MAG: class I SAM-dependent methyltransferase [Deltaproteobacteria bacterium]|nr:class I SAM-dependent methyltransferase [Deltaproteobacteria bacterium]
MKDDKLIYGRGWSQHVIDAVAGKNLAILDVGCGAGGTGQKLEELGHKVYGLDLCPVSVKEASARITMAGVINLDQSSSLPFEKNYFDRALFADILEHVYSPRHALELVRPYLRNDGKIIISIPNAANYVIRFNLLLGRFSSGDSPIIGDPGHIRFFTLKSISDLVRQTGYVIESVDCTAGIYLPLGGLHIGGVPVVQRMREFISRAWKTMFATQFLIVARKND